MEENITVVHIAVLIVVLLASACSESDLVNVPRGQWRFVLLAYQRTELPEGQAVLRDALAVHRAADILFSWVPRARWDAISDAGVVRKVSWYVNSLCPTRFAAIGPGDTWYPGGYHGYVGLWAPPPTVPVCMGGWAWPRQRWAQVYEYPSSDPTEGIIHELAHIVEWYATTLGYNVLGVDNAPRAGYSCDPTPSGCSWMRFLRDYYTGAFQGAIPQSFWTNN